MVPHGMGTIPVRRLPARPCATAMAYSR